MQDSSSSQNWKPWKCGLRSHEVGVWLSGEGENSDIVVSSRIRLARNVSGMPFLSKTSAIQQIDVMKHINEALNRAINTNGRNLTDMLDMSVLEAQFLLERHLISPDFLQSRMHRGFFTMPDESFSLMVNEEDHLRMQYFGSGLSLKECWAKLDEIDKKFNNELPFAFDDRYGFLTACPTNVGTGMRASILIHLPGIVLTKEIDRVLRGVLQLGLSVRGTYGEGTETKGHLFQISNQRTLGQSEAEIIDTLQSMALQLVKYEREARNFLQTKMKIHIDDKVLRSLGILTHALTLNSEETLNLLSTLRLGLYKIRNLDPGKLNRLMIITRPANLQFFYNKELSPDLRDIKRAELIRRTLKDADF